MRIIVVHCMWLVLLVAGEVCAQSSLLDDMIIEAIDQHQSIKKVQLQRSVQASKWEQAKKLWRPNIDASAAYLIADGGRTIDFPVGDLLNPAYITLNQLTQSQSFPENIENVSTQLTPNNFIDASISISKPLINSNIKYNAMIQEAMLSIYDLNEQEQKVVLRHQVKLAYFNLLKTLQGQSVIDENLELLGSVLNFNKKLVKHQKATIDILTDVEYQISNLKNQKHQLQHQTNTATVVLNTLLGRSYDTEVPVDSFYLLDFIPLTESLDEMIHIAISNRVEFSKLQLLDDIIGINMKRIDRSNQPTIGANGGVGLQVQEFSFNEGGPLYTLGLKMDWKLMDGGLKKERLQEQKLLIEENAMNQQLLVDQIRIDVATAYYQLQSLQTRLSDEKEAVISAEKSYEAVYKKYKNQKAILIEVLNAQNKITNSQLAQKMTLLELHIAKAQIERLLQR